jgi:hypothetical protein
VVPLSPPTGGSSAGCANVTRELALDILMHNADFRGGAVRGQLAK